MSDPPSVRTGSSLTDSVLDKVVLVGDVGVGKTSLFLRFKTGQFQETTPSHNPRDGEHQKEWTVGGKKVSVSTVLQCVVLFTYSWILYCVLMQMFLSLSVLFLVHIHACIATPCM